MEAAPTNPELADPLRRLGRARRARRRYRRARRTHWLGLGVLLVLAFLWRAGLPVPGVGWVAERPWVAAGIAVLLFLLGPLVGMLARRVMRIDVMQTARRVDDRHGYGDETSTALSAPPDPAGLDQLLVAQARGRVRQLASDAKDKRGGVSNWPAGILAFLILFVLLAPGVRGTWFGDAAGAGDEALIGVQNRESAGGGLRLFSDDQWLSVFVEDPAPVEALGASEASEGDAAVEADK